MSYSSIVRSFSARTATTGLLGCVLALGLLVSGDKSVWSAGAGNAGVDPLEILNLAVRPNAIFVMDSSGSMGDTVNNVSGLSDDDPDSKINTAKSVIRQVISANQSRVSFQFGIYDQQPTTISVVTQNSQSLGASRFQYTVKNPSPAADPAVQLMLFEVPVGSNWTVAFANGSTSYTTAALTPGVYTGTDLANQIATLMNAQDNSGYAGSFVHPATTTAPVFTFTRSGGTLPFVMKFSLMNATLQGLLRAAQPSGSFTGDTNDVTSPFSIKPNVGTFTTFTVGPPGSFVVAGAPSIRIGRGGTNFTGTLTNGTYSGATLATHIASVMSSIDTGITSSVPPNSFTISTGPTIKIKRGALAAVSTVLTNGTYTGAALATHIAQRMNFADVGNVLGTAVATYSGAYNTGTGVFTFTRAGTDVANSFQILWSAWSLSLQGASAAAGGIKAPTVDATDASNPYSLATAGGLTPIVTTLDSYAGSYNPANGQFTFTRTGVSASSFDIGWSVWTAALRTLIAAPSTNASAPSAPFALSTNGFPAFSTSGSAATSTGPTNSTAPLVLYRRTANTSYTVTDGANTYYSAYANKFFNGQNLTVLPDGTPCSYTTSATVPPVVSPAIPPMTVQVRSGSTPAVCSDPITSTTTFLLRGPSVVLSSGNDCGGFKTLSPLADCLNNNQLSTIDTPFLQNDLLFSGSSIVGYTETDGVGTSTAQPTSGSRDPVTGVLTPGGGIRASQSTPIAESLIDIRTIFTVGIGSQPATPFQLALPSVRAIWPVIAAQTKKQRTFVIFVTDGDDTCDTTTTTTSGTDNDALRAAHKAQQLYTRFVATEPESSVTTYFVAFGSGAAANRSNWIAWGGSGMQLPTTGSGAATRWANTPTAADRTACTTCKDAFLATNAAALSTALQSVIDQGQTSGEFSDQQSITESVYEYVDRAPLPIPATPTPTPTVSPTPLSPLNPRGRYVSSIPVLLQSTFELPEFNGHLKAYTRGDNGTPNNLADDVSVNLWDAGAKLIQRVVSDPGAMGPTATYTFAQLYGNATPTTVKSSSAVIKRRIFTTTSQGVLSTYNSQNLLSANAGALQGSTTLGDPVRTEIWPPAASVAPTANNPAPAGTLDNALGIGALTTIAQVQAVVPMACVPSSDVPARIHADCTSATASVQLARAKREAREAILAYLAGAKVSSVNSFPNRTTAGDVLFVSRPWIMSESTLAAPAVVTPPLGAETLKYHPKEYILYRDGPRNGAGAAINAIQNGLGLRNPDLETPQTTASLDDTNLKPQMSVVYHATNQGLHAFRAGPCPTSVLSGGFLAAGSLNCSGETGGEELWAFVPFDQLKKLPSLLQTQSRSNKTYILASPVRVTDVFVSGTASATVGGQNVTVAGVWRTIALFGRGIAGKNMTALDVTVPGPFTSHSLNTNPPIVVWSRGNHDTRDGLASVTTNLVHNQADYDAYEKMGETWSVPAIGFVKPTLHTTARRPGGVEFTMYMGSGYSDVSTEGHTFYVLDALSGDVIQSFDLANGTVVQAGLSLPNVIPASPAIYAVEASSGISPAGFPAGFLSNPVEAEAKQVYFGDLHSRVWRYSPGTPTIAPVVLADLSSDGDQPLANGFALLEHVIGAQKVPLLFMSAGRDSRVNLRTSSPRFRMYGYADGVSATPPSAVVTQLFARDFPVNYRGNSAPAAGFTGGDTDNNPSTPAVFAPIVFFTGLSFSAGSDPTQPCLSRFDSVLFALQGATGLAALNLNASSSLESDDAYATIQGQVLQNPHITNEGTLVIDRGLGAQSAPPPPAPPGELPLPPQTTSTTMVSEGVAPFSVAHQALRATTRTRRNGSSVCNVNP